VPVSFAASAGSLSATTAIADASGEARVSLTVTQEATVTARAGSKESSAVTVRVRTAVGITVAVTTANPTEDAPVTISITPSPSGTVLRNVRVEFGDGSATDLTTVTAATNISHVYTSDGTFTIQATGIDPAGDPAFGSTTIVVLPQVPLSVSLGVSSNPIAGQVTTFTATVTSATPVTSYRWDFADGTVETSNSNTKTHVYAAPGIYRVTVRVSNQGGQSASANRDIQVN
jgi:PKD repeat protein